ncbi:hypothetical protein LZ554_004290 [Drepanopeziza brunnea f. sp. 'monogermtubi']|nr:hypothetical protein LZ554_004290 [Drepanopeziza brunnea f. sp. 'monogermtubi']
MRFDRRNLAAKIGTLAAFGPHLFVIIWAGSDITGGLLQAYDRVGYEPSNAISIAIGASSSALGLSTAAIHPKDGMFLYKSQSEPPNLIPGARDFILGYAGCFTLLDGL